EVAGDNGIRASHENGAIGIAVLNREAAKQRLAALPVADRNRRRGPVTVDDRDLGALLADEFDVLVEKVDIFPVEARRDENSAAGKSGVNRALNRCHVGRHMDERAYADISRRAFNRTQAVIGLEGYREWSVLGRVRRPCERTGIVVVVGERRARWQSRHSQRDDIAVRFRGVNVEGKAMALFNRFFLGRGDCNDDMSVEADFADESGSASSAIMLESSPKGIDGVAGTIGDFTNRKTSRGITTNGTVNGQSGDRRRLKWKSGRVLVRSNC